jgi:hypothetical protein
MVIEGNTAAHPRCRGVNLHDRCTGTGHSLVVPSSTSHTVAAAPRRRWRCGARGHNELSIREVAARPSSQRLRTWPRPESSNVSHDCGPPSPPPSATFSFATSRRVESRAAAQIKPPRSRLLHPHGRILPRPPPPPACCVGGDLWQPPHLHPASSSCWQAGVVGWCRPLSQRRISLPLLRRPESAGSWQEGTPRTTAACLCPTLGNSYDDDKANEPTIFPPRHQPPKRTGIVNTEELHEMARTREFMLLTILQNN